MSPTPNITFTANSYAKNNDRSNIVSIQSILEHCKTGISINAKKGSSGCIYPYVSNIVGSNQKYISDGIIFIDIDHCSEISNIIFENFELLCNRMPNIVAMNFSHSKNIHFYIYDNNIKGECDKSKYTEYATKWLAVLSAVILKITNIDLRLLGTKENPAIDTHNTNITQRFFLNQSDYKYNNKFAQVNISNKDYSKIKNEYPTLFREYDITPISKNSIIPRIYSNINKFNPNDYSGNKIAVNQEYSICNRKGYDARTVIVSAAYFHFGMDEASTVQYLNTVYSNSKEMVSQFESLIKNDKISKFYNKSVEDLLFTDGFEIIKLDQDEYLSEKIDFDNLNDKYIYIQSNTNTGKTEFIKRLLKNQEHICVVQLNKALRDGKKQGVEEYTIQNNWDKVVNVDKIFSTIDSVIRNIDSIPVEETSFIVDESHILQDYMSISGRDTMIESLIDVLTKAKKVIFLTATPKQDINIFPFRKLKFEKIQPIELYIYRIPIKYSGKGSKEAGKYEFMTKSIKSCNHRNIIFSDRKQEAYKKYGFADVKNVTYFNSQNISDPAVQDILNNNKLTNHTTLCTNFCSAGVEMKIKGDKKIIKEERDDEEIVISMCLDEGFTKDYIEQCIGRPRDAKKIHLCLFYTNNERKIEPKTTEEMLFINNCFKNLIISDNGFDYLNIVAAKGINMFDYNYNMHSDDVKEKIKQLKLGNILNYTNCISANDVETMKNLPYQKVEIIDEPQQTVFIGGVKSKSRNENKLIDYLLSFNTLQLKQILSFNMGSKYKNYDEMLNDMPYEDRVNARKVLEAVKRLLKNNIPLKEAMEYFENLNKANKINIMLRNYIDIKRGDVKMKEFEGSDKEIEKINEDMKKVETIFTPEFLENMTKQINVEDNSDFDVFAEILNNDGELMDFENNISIFKDKKYSDISKKVNNNSSNNARKTIKILRLIDNVVLEFGSNKEAADALGVTSPVISRLKKGKSELKNEYKIL